MNNKEKSTFLWSTEKNPPMTLNDKIKFHLNHCKVTTTNNLPVTILSTKANIESKYDIVALVHLPEKDFIEWYQSNCFDKGNNILMTDSASGYNLLLQGFNYD